MEPMNNINSFASSFRPVAVPTGHHVTFSQSLGAWLPRPPTLAPSATGPVFAECSSRPASAYREFRHAFGLMSPKSL
ncbi:unnamed protein product [Protopolystoma xenopodis]|uniref:Uncharacterized protein n=1 Tax=Protopolystoma xenopodis TaxID=117903 RepID=A0A448WC43_9PLAT|nr:unnamed protein product [Protopolystoma xenopodis]